jgi:hypothetical protein
MYNLERFTTDDMYQCAIKLRNLDSRSSSMEELANQAVRYLYENILDPRTGKPACALVRFFKTHPYSALDLNLQYAARDIVGGHSLVMPYTKCLTLLATAGDRPEWSSRHSSTGHKAIPLVSKAFVDQAPMISQLVQQFGLNVEDFLNPTPEILMDEHQKTFNVFHISEALNSPYIPAQQEFVIPYGIQSVMGFGGMLPSGNIFAIIMFVKMPISRSTADLFRYIAAYVRIAAASFDQGVIFAESAEVSYL